MDCVLGLSLTTTALRWVLVAGRTGDGEPIDRGEVDIPDLATLDADLLVHAVLNPDVVAEEAIRVVGVTATKDAESAAAEVVAAFVARDHRDVVSVSDDAAVAALADGIVDITDYDDVAVCVVEPDSAFVALVESGWVTVEDIDRPADRADAIELTSSALTALDGHPTDAIFVIGSDDVGVLVSAFEAVADAPVISAAEADLALARGAALAAARTLDMSDRWSGEPTVLAGRAGRTGVLAAILAVAVVTFVVSVSLALQRQATHVTPAKHQTVTAAADYTPVPAAGKPSVAFPEAGRSFAQTMIAKAPPPPAAVPAAVPTTPPRTSPPRRVASGLASSP
ncbi:hypothetical protein MMAD_09740 [Mycolicibacterium madagascariense]|uniref:DUF7159 domain-containing protein n=1 Tax=Mycolicibacterium madagascariense TaxID=212765 RepID=A0A7I7XA85_9MYCO|nr:hypothetical protein [Mycolicibacterium madagascariense]MCV7011300.1 hypothetical protein [Mycolicibacterium madagascariense]BBZ26679.1 hypothetical protein MMAD_09740 [Mycolicibacterium madagascariense]